MNAKYGVGESELVCIAGSSGRGSCEGHLQQCGCVGSGTPPLISASWLRVKPMCMYSYLVISVSSAWKSYFPYLEPLPGMVLVSLRLQEG